MNPDDYLDKCDETIRIAQIVQDAIAKETEDGWAGICACFCCVSICAIDNDLSKKKLVHCLEKVFDFVKKGIKKDTSDGK